jgi:hypothetical protein
MYCDTSGRVTYRSTCPSAISSSWMNVSSAWSGRRRLDLVSSCRAQMGNLGRLCKLLIYLVEPMGFEPTTSSMPSRRAPNCATAPPEHFLMLAQARNERLRRALSKRATDRPDVRALAQGDFLPRPAADR